MPDDDKCLKMTKAAAADIANNVWCPHPCTD